jgi:hypothetical protein
MLDHSHQIWGMEDNRSRIIGRNVGEPLDVTTREISRVLDDQGVEAAPLQVIPNQFPAPLELSDRDP